MSAGPCISFLEWIRGDNSNSPQSSSDLLQLMADPYVSLSENGEKIIIVANFLPLNAQQDKSGKWCFSYDEDSILLQLTDGISSDIEVLYVGSLTVDIEESEQDKVSLELQEEFKCLPTFLPPDIRKMFYNGFCKQYLWPLFHYMLPMNLGYGNRFDGSLWNSYVTANQKFTDKVIEAINDPRKDYVWIHDYHLMVLPIFLRRRYNRFKLGFFLHIREKERNSNRQKTSSIVFTEEQYYKPL